MSKRKVVQLNLDTIGPIIKSKCRSYTIFCEQMGRQSYWITNWGRKDEFGNPKPKNLPSPEEAAKMCVILDVQPEEILVKQEDIDLVCSLLPEPGPPAVELDDFTYAMHGESKNLSDEDKDILLKMARQLAAANKKRHGETD